MYIYSYNVPMLRCANVKYVHMIHHSQKKIEKGVNKKNNAGKMKKNQIEMFQD